MTKDEEIQMRKRNMKLYPTYKKIASDYLFYYTIDFLFLTQVKQITPADVVLSTSIKSLFGIFLQMLMPQKSNKIFIINLKIKQL